MKRAVLFVFAFATALPLALCVPVLKAQGPIQGPAQAIDASKMPESGPAMVGGTGSTIGPNSKNQAVMPMPGLRQDEELSELPRDATLPLPEVRPMPSPRRATSTPSSR
ncbi:hypothetical protein [Reyranella soli]|jgi:hypothetical protein|uniref:Uncharacterized protein n=1 Tax=Reyranella soli TaxID=1230389 RepID=A0A512NHE6_9HYPH|nr:hypothetical protein [Reyranella soli]GEP58374.1 hypothetical protein RSO01_55400 [Reyranella soli]